MTPVCHLSLPLLPSVSRSLFLSSLLLGFVAFRLCGWSRHLSFALPSSCQPHFPGQDGFCAVLPLLSFCLSALPVSGSFCGRDFVPPPFGVHAAGAARLEVSPVCTREFSGISSSVDFLSLGRLLCLFSFCLLCFFVLCVSQPKKSRGVVLYGHMKCRGSWVPLEFLLALSRTLRLVLTCSHDSLFLRYPAIDIVWRGPVSLAFGFLRPLALRGSAWWSGSPGWCSIQYFSRTSVLPLMTLTVPILLRWSRLWHQTPLVSLFLSCVCVPSASTPLLLHIPPSGSMIEIVLIKYSGNRIIGNVISISTLSSYIYSIIQFARQSYL